MERISMPCHNNKSGFILPLTLSIIGLAIVLVTYIVNNGRAFTPAARMMIEREQARMLARSGIEIAMSQLSTPDKKEEQGAKKAPETPPKEGAQEATPTPEKKESQQQETFFSYIMPRMNVWQLFPLKRTVEGMHGEIGICLMSEEGKLDLNELYDASKGELVDASLSGVIDLVFKGLEKSIDRTDLRKAFEEKIKERKRKWDDVSELLTIKGFEGFQDKLFYNPPEKPEKNAASKEAKQSLYLTDIFTIWSGKKTVQPWLFSEGLRSLLDLPSAQSMAMEEKKKIIAEIAKTIPDALTWPDGWNKYLKLWYRKEFAALPKGVDKLLDTKFEPAIFSVICYGKVGKTTQKAFAILERTKAPDEKDKPQINVRLKKLYWI
jgi:hypothetical protein